MSNVFVTVGSFSNEDGDGSKNVAIKVFALFQSLSQ